MQTSPNLWAALIAHDIIKISRSNIWWYFSLTSTVSYFILDFYKTDIWTEKQIAFLRCIFKKSLSDMHLKAGNIHEEKRGGGRFLWNCVYFYVVLCFYFYRQKGKQISLLSKQVIKTFLAVRKLFVSAHVMRMMQSLAFYSPRVSSEI